MLALAVIGWVVCIGLAVPVWLNYRVEYAITQVNELGFEIRKTINGLGLYANSSADDVALTKAFSYFKSIPKLNALNFTYHFLIKITELKTLTELSLEYVNISLSDVSNLEPLRGMPLKELYLGGNHKIVGLTPLAGMGVAVYGATNSQSATLLD